MMEGAKARGDMRLQLQNSVRFYNIDKSLCDVDESCVAPHITSKIYRSVHFWILRQAGKCSFLEQPRSVLFLEKSSVFEGE